MKNLYQKGNELKKELTKAPIANLYLMRTLELVLNNLNLSKHDSTLEIRHGSGFETFIISKRSREVVAVDISEPLIGFFKKKLKLDNADFYRVDATAFDKCICLDMLEHVEERRRL